MAWGGFGGKGGGSSGRSDAARFPALAEVRGYWIALCEAPHLPPFRDRIDPRGIAGALERTFLVERVAPGVARFRLAGMHLTDLMGMDVRGMPVASFLVPEGRNAAASLIEEVFARPACVEMALEAERGLGRPALEGRLLFLPLRDHHGRVSLALGCLATDGAAGRAPRRFAVARSRVTQLSPAIADRALMPGLAEPAADYVPVPRAGPGRTHLRLVKG